MVVKTMCIFCYLISSVIYGSPLIERLSWPVMKSFDIWNAATNIGKNNKNLNYIEFKKSETLFNDSTNDNKMAMKQKKSKAHVDGECLSNDGRRSGICLNKYECRLNGGSAKGDCSMGFGVCCVFLASCNQTIFNNITYLVSPNFPSSMPGNFTSCKFKVKMMDSTISQLRIDFNHFSLGQPNRKTGICEGDMLNISGGPTGNFSLCGQNGGQHILPISYNLNIKTSLRLLIVYYDVHGANSGRQVTTAANNISFEDSVANKDGTIDITMTFTQRFLPIRFWEIRISQIPFSQRAPNGCLQYFSGSEGVVQTFNFADNGRHLANQHYKSCIRQEINMCSIMYQPCDDQSFRIGPISTTEFQNDIMSDSLLDTVQDSLISQGSIPSSVLTSNTATSTDFALIGISTASPNLADDEGSGQDNLELPVITSRTPVHGGFDILSFFRTVFSFKSKIRTSRQFFTTCTDRITMPCIIEDFVGVGMGPLPECEPVHCGSHFCASGIKPCRTESTVTPFYIGVNFGDGKGKGSAEDNIGACIRFTQMQCI